MLANISASLVTPVVMSCHVCQSRARIREAAESAQVDDEKKGMGGYESKMRMDDMPIDSSTGNERQLSG